MNKDSEGDKRVGIMAIGLGLLALIIYLAPAFASLFWRVFYLCCSPVLLASGLMLLRRGYAKVQTRKD